MPEDPDFIWEKVLKILDAAEKTGIAIEINTSGFYKPAHEQYPSERIINELVSRNIPITLGSDAHEPSKIAYRFSEIASLLKRKEDPHSLKSQSVKNNKFHLINRFISYFSTLSFFPNEILQKKGDKGYFFLFIQYLVQAWLSQLS